MPPLDIDIYDLLRNIKSVWENDYSWVNIQLHVEEGLEYRSAKDIFRVIFDNLILNSIQQNDASLRISCAMDVAFNPEVASIFNRRMSYLYLLGKVIIDKKENSGLCDMMNRQGLMENDIYKLFIAIIIVGINSFERYRQSIIRCIAKTNEPKKERKTKYISISSGKNCSFSDSANITSIKAIIFLFILRFFCKSPGISLCIYFLFSSSFTISQSSYRFSAFIIYSTF